jgi:hypothetical protein
LPDWVPGLIKGSGIAEEDLSALVQYMLKTDVLFVADGLLALGQTGEARYGLKNFLELFSVFSSPPLFTVLHGRVEIGQVHRLSFQVQGGQPMTLALGGHQWAVKHIDWDRRQAYVEPTELRGRSRWLGSGQPMHFALCQSIKGVLLEEVQAPGLSKRATGRLQELRADYLWLKAGQTSLVHEGPATQWWTFAGALANGVLAKVLRDDGCTSTFDDFSLNLGNAREAAGGALRADAPPDRPTRFMGAIELSTTAAGESRAAVVVRDRGAGIAEADLPHVFEPYFTTKRSGTGLGLAIARNIVEALGGTIAVKSAAGEGTEVRIELPPSPPPRALAPGSAG